MKKIVNIPIDNATPTAEMVIQAQGVPRSVTPDERIVLLAQEAIAIYRAMAKPIGVIMELSKEDFEDIYSGEGRNDTSSPVQPIFRDSDDLALFAVTIDEDICQEISRQFSVGDYALGAMLDSTASEGTEMTAQAVEDLYRSHLQSIKRFKVGSGILRFSPGYCGWHISGQRKLFRSLRPEDIGIELNQSYLMKPIKSISGIIVSGKKEIFEFEDAFSFCADCTTHSCRERIEAIRRQ
jgi:hypothetical protein